MQTNTKAAKKIKHRESLGNFGPAFVCDPWVVSHIQAGQVLVHLKHIDRKGVVSGGLLTWIKMHGKGVSIVGENAQNRTMRVLLI